MRAITLRVWSDAAKLQRALYEVTLRGNQRTRTDVYDAPRRNLPIAADGGFSDVEGFTTRSSTGLFTAVERFAGTIGASGAKGTFAVATHVSSPSQRAHDRALRVGHGALDGGDMSPAANAWRRAGRRHAAGPAPTLY